MENQIFSLGRFTAYLKKYLSENRSIRLQFIILTGVFSALLAISGGSMNFLTSQRQCLYLPLYWQVHSRHTSVQEPIR